MVQNSRSQVLNDGRGRLRLRTATCWRRARISKAASVRVRKRARMAARRATRNGKQLPAQMSWTATVGDYTLVSDPIATSSSSYAEIGQERNGVFNP